MTEDGHSAHTDTKDGIRKDLRNYRVQDNVYIAVFWKVLGIGKGPALSLYVKDREVLKFDCFGKDKGHYHAQTLIAEDTEEHRIFFREPTVMGQIERTVFELRRNLSYYLQRHPVAEVRAVQIDPLAINAASKWAGMQMLQYLLAVPELSDMKAREMPQQPPSKPTRWQILQRLVRSGDAG